MTRSEPDWKVGDRLRHRFNAELGPGIVRTIEGRTVVVLFPRSATELRLSGSSDALDRFVPRQGAFALLESTGETVRIRDVPDPLAGRVLLEDGREVDEDSLWPAPAARKLSERLARGEVDSLESISMRHDALHFANVRQADGLGSFLGGRIRIFPHQLHAAERATASDPVRWLLADEVGLGKTVEACLILNRLARAGRAERTLIVAPETLTIQWLGELWRKYHQVFVVLDEKRLNDVEKDFGAGFNPFDAHRNVVVGAEFLIERPWLTERAVAAGIDLLVVDEAHHLRRRAGHPGNPAYRAIRPIADLGRNVLLLTATPLEEDAFGFLRLVQLLRPDAFADGDVLESRLERGEPLPPCTSATRRADIGGLPPRSARPVAFDESTWSPAAEPETRLRRDRQEGPLARRRLAERLRRCGSSPPSLIAVLDRNEEALKRVARDAARADPRIAWLAERGQEWKRRGDKTLVFVADRDGLEWLRRELSRRAQLRTGVFHEDLSPGQRDIEVAQFRTAGGPSMLVSTECGGEGRNFEFCTRLVMFDLPWNPATVEQRIGRLDRIGRASPVEIVYFKPPSGVTGLVAETFESLGLFEEPLGSIGRELAEVGAAIERAATEPGPLPTVSSLSAELDRARGARERVRTAAYRELHREPYHRDKAAGILERIPQRLDELTRDVVLAISERLQLHVEEHRRGLRYSIELGTRSRVASLPGLSVGSSFLGTFDRDEAVREESIDFFASGHPLVEGLMAWADESDDGRVGLLHGSSTDDETGFGLLALYRDGVTLRAVAVDVDGVERPQWAAQLVSRPLRSRRVRPEQWTSQPGWEALIGRLARPLEERGVLEGLYAFRLDPRRQK